MQAIEIETEIDENHEIHVKLPNEAIGPVKLIVLLEDKVKDVPRSVRLGLFRGQIKISDDFDDPLPDEFWLSGKP